MAEDLVDASVRALLGIAGAIDAGVDPRLDHRPGAHRAGLLADAAVGAAVVVDEDLPRVAAGLGIAAEGLAHEGLAARGALAVLAEDDDVDRLLRADVVAGPAEHADLAVVVVHRVALEAADRLDDRLAIGPGQLALRHVVALARLEDRRIGAGEVLRLAVVVGAFHHRLVEAEGVVLGLLAEVLADRP